jgi:outer membrane lipoprotein-sorting protein
MRGTPAIPVPHFLLPQTRAIETAMRRPSILFFLTIIAVAVVGAGQPPHPGALSEADRADLDKVSAYLNSLHTLQGEFVQIDPNGEIDQGTFYLERPGHLRFEYKPPSPILIVADGRYIAVANKKLKTVDRTLLSLTPLDLIIGDDIDLRHNDSILKVERQPGELIVDARTSRSRATPNLTLVFAEPELELRQWTVIDDQGLSTTVALRNLQPNVAIDPSLFVLRDMKAPVGIKQRD